GGAGHDTADYSARSDRLRITIDGNADDGASENDNVGLDVEGVIGGTDYDYIIGSAGNDTLIGALSPGSSTRAGDRIYGDDGDDTIDVADGDTFRDSAKCGRGLGDSLVRDLVERSSSTCESDTAQ